MKKLVLFATAIVAISFASCGNKANTDATTPADSTTVTVDTATVTVDTAAVKVDSAAVKVDSATVKK